MLPEVKPLLREKLAGTGARIHLIGIAGSGMTGIARLLIEHGHRVSGSDLRRTPELEKLVALGVHIHQGHEAGHVEGADLIVYSSAVRADNAERQHAGALGIPCVLRAECLAVLGELKDAVVVAGMHGKTTTASMLGYTLRSAGLDAAHYIGAEVPILGASAAWGAGRHFVIEGDESDGTIRLYHPYATILLNVEEEHLDYFGCIERIMETFATLLEQTRGPIIYCADDKNSILLCSHRDHAVGYGFSEIADYRILDVDQEQFRSRFKLIRRGQLLGDITINVPGKQNIANAAGVAAMATELGVDWANISAALEEFRGAKRRFEVRSKSRDFMVVDDYAHHPTEIKATLAAAKNSGWKRILAMFQPHRYSRTKLLLHDFASAFRDADCLFLTGIYPAGEPPIEGVSGEALADAVRAGGHPSVDFAANLTHLRISVSRAVEPGDLILTMGAGDIHMVATQLVQELEGFRELRELLKPESVLRRHEPMSKHTSIRIGGPADLWFEPCDEDDLAKALRYASIHSIPVTLIGRGTNLLVRDGGIRGLCVHLGQPRFSAIHIDGTRVEVGAGARLKTVVLTCKRHGLGGFEFMEGIPGNIGGALRMNAGAMKGWTMEVVEEVRTMDMMGNLRVARREDLHIEYRSVPHFQNHIAISAVLRGIPAAPEEIEERLKAYSEKRWESQPAASSAGCIFKNPGPCPAGKLIDELGLKNTGVGQARVSEVHGNFIVNDGGAAARDVLKLIDLIKAKARLDRNIDLETEVMILGEDL
jgi:UDP-N-acetylmuramate--L-alanine ligase/UDP-N-acetylenolpyruvoylglucosamine reductase